MHQCHSRGEYLQAGSRVVPHIGVGAHLLKSAFQTPIIHEGEVSITGSWTGVLLFSWPDNVTICSRVSPHLLQTSATAHGFSLPLPANAAMNLRGSPRSLQPTSPQLATRSLSVLSASTCREKSAAAN